MSKADQVIAYGLAEVGDPYVWGAEGPDAFDCSGLMQWIFGKAGIDLPRTAAQQQRATTPVRDPRPGDLVFWGTPAHHVGLYVGDGRFLAAPRSGERVRVAKVYGTPEYRRVKALGGPGGAVGAVVSPITDPITAGLGDAVLGSADWLKTGVLAAGGVALVVIGMWHATKGERA
ncbi:C40 family peptidase [Micromonospora sp.]|uniref:C40 family peptidase n=1 Tax=Micromonospora sp. TaxID=1876 RepID=UPI003B3B2E81